MYPSQHLFFGILFATLLWIFIPGFGVLGFSVLVLSILLIDVDHYIYYVYKKRDLNLINAYYWFIEKDKKFNLLSRKEKNIHYQGFVFLHGFEVLLPLFILGIFYKPFLYVFSGFFFHILLDVFYHSNQHDRLDRVSLVYDFFKFRKMKYIDHNI
ncbi:MAG: hypothetical protein AABW81_02250 [Nanoarchaeota archaeon]